MVNRSNLLEEAMQDQRWSPWQEALGADTSPAPPVGSFSRRLSDGAVTVQPFAAPALPPRVLGTDPAAPSWLPQRLRNTANRAVYTIQMASALARRPAPPGAARVRVPVIGEIAAGRYEVTVAYRDYLDHEHGIELE